MQDLPKGWEHVPFSPLGQTIANKNGALVVQKKLEKSFAMTEWFVVPAPNIPPVWGFFTIESAIKFADSGFYTLDGFNRSESVAEVKPVPVEVPAQPVPETKKKFAAFWGYDQFPYVLGSTAHVDEDLSIDVSGYWKMSPKSIIAFMPIEYGADTLERLTELKSDYEESLEKLKQAYKNKALEILPALALTKQYGGKL